MASAAAESVLDLALPVLAGSRSEVLFEHAAVSSSDGCTVFRAGPNMGGFTVAAAPAPLEEATRELYGRIFAAAGGLRLCRIWNYVPHINAIHDGLETYRRFCRGRSVAFEEKFGPGFERDLPAGSAVGIPGGALAVAFFAHENVPRHFENPHQVPAFEYPADYGPRPPSFSRATLVTTNAGTKLFISGTASIRGHLTLAPNDLAGQLPCTVENLQVIAQTAGAGAAVGAENGWARAFKIYLRQAADLPAARAYLERHLLQPGDNVSYLLADLCRTDLRVEIEAVLSQS